MTKLLMLASAACLMAPSVAPAQDAQAGKRVFNKCIACHAVGPNAPNKIGPELNGLFGRTAGSVESYVYSPANKQSGIIWDEETFASYIKDPRGVIKGTKMVFAGIKNEQEIKDLTVYLQSFGVDGRPN